MHIFYPLLSVLYLLAIIGFLAYLIRFAAGDALRRGKKPIFVVIACVFFFPWGLIAWLLFRPDPIDGDIPPRPFQLEDYRVQ